MKEKFRMQVATILLLFVLAFVLAIAYHITHITRTAEAELPARNQAPEARAMEGPTFDDLLDAIEWVESRGDANAVGDNGRAVGAYQIHQIYIDDVRRITDRHARIFSIWSAGFYPISWADHTDIEVRKDKKTCRILIYVYLEYYATFSRIGREPTFEDMARIHNSGPDGWRNDPEWFVRNRDYTLEKAKKKIKNTKKYWLKVKARMESEILEM